MAGNAVLDHRQRRIRALARVGKRREADRPRPNVLRNVRRRLLQQCSGCVIGGGDSAAEESLFLTRFASKIYLIHRRDTLRASKIMAERVLAYEKIEPIWNTSWSNTFRMKKAK